MIEKQSIRIDSKPANDHPKNSKPFATAAQILFLAASVLASGCATATPPTHPAAQAKTPKSTPLKKDLLYEDYEELLCEDLILERTTILQDIVEDLYTVEKDKSRVKVLQQQLHGNQMQLNHVKDRCGLKKL